MARVTVEDCLLKVHNKFELVLLASKRARDIERGATPSVPKDNDKPTILALREIAEETISLDGLRELTKKSLVEEETPSFSVNPSEEIEEEMLNNMTEENTTIEEDSDDTEEDIEDISDENMDNN